MSLDMDVIQRLDLLVKATSGHTQSPHRHAHSPHRHRHGHGQVPAMAGRMGLPRSPRGNPAVRELENEPASRIFDQFCAANTFHGITNTFQQLCDLLELRPSDHCIFYKQLKQQLNSWKAQSLWARLDKRAAHKEYKKGTPCNKTRVLVIGSGPCGLRTAIEVALLGGKAVIVEKRDRFSRNSVLHLWPFLIHDLKALGAKKFFGKFCAGSIDHISIRTLQCILLKVALLVGVEVHTGVTYLGLKEPPDDQSHEKIGWRAQVAPPDHPVSEFDFDVLMGCDGKRNTVAGFKRKEFRGKLAIAITANFINRFSQAEARVEEISGVAYIFNQKFFKDLNKKSGIDLENIVYYKDETHYFVMTAKKHSLLDKGVLIQDFEDPEKLLSKDNVDQEALESYAREAANISTNEMLPALDFAHNHYGQPDVAMFDFTSIYHAVHASKVTEKNGYRLLMGLAGDSLLEPFWPTGSGCARGFLGSLDAAWMIRSWASESMTPLEVMAERESVYQLLSQTTPENLSKNFHQYTIDPNTRYPNLNPLCIRPYQVRFQYEGVDPQALDNIVKISEQNSKKYEWMRDSHLLLKWFQRQLEPYRHIVKVLDMTTSFRSGMALCALIHKYRPELIDIYSLDSNMVADNNDQAFQIAEREFGIAPVMTGQELAMSEFPNKVTMVSYLSKFYEHFRKESIRPAKIAQTPENIPVNVAVGMRSSKPKATSARLAYLNRISSRLRQKQQQRATSRNWSSSEDILDYFDDGKENEDDDDDDDRRLKQYRQPLYTYGLAKKRIKALNNDDEEDDESVMLANYGKFENVDLSKVKHLSHLERTRKEIAFRRELGGLEAGVRGKNKVSSMAQDLARKTKVRGTPIDEAHKRSKHKDDRIAAMAKDLAEKFTDETAAPEKRKKNPKPLIMGKAHPADPCYFCKKKVYLVEKHMAEGLTFHRGCFRCDYCQTNLRIGGYAFQRAEEGDGQPKFFCFQHYGLKKPARHSRKRSHGEKDLKSKIKSPTSPKEPRVTESSKGEKMETDGLDVTPERIEYVTESEQEESEMDQTAHNLSASLLDLGSGDSDSDNSTDDELDWSDDEMSDPDVSWTELARNYNKQLKHRRERRPSGDADESSTETETVGGGSEADYDTDTETEKDIPFDDKPCTKPAGPKEKASSLSSRAIFGFSPPPPVETKPSPTSQEIMRSRMAFFNAVSEPVRIDARSFLGLYPPPPPVEPKEEIKEEEEEEGEETPVGSQEDEDVDAMLDMIDRELLEQELRELEEEENRRRTLLSGDLDKLFSVAAEDRDDQDFLPVLQVEGASSSDDSGTPQEEEAVFLEELSSESSQQKKVSSAEMSPAEVCPEKDATDGTKPVSFLTSTSDEEKADMLDDILHITEDELRDNDDNGGSLDDSFSDLEILHAGTGSDDKTPSPTQFGGKDEAVMVAAAVADPTPDKQEDSMPQSHQLSSQGPVQQTEPDQSSEQQSPCSCIEPEPVSVPRADIQTDTGDIVDTHSLQTPGEGSDVKTREENLVEETNVKKVDETVEEHGAKTEDKSDVDDVAATEETAEDHEIKSKDEKTVHPCVTTNSGDMAVGDEIKTNIAENSTENKIKDKTDALVVEGDRNVSLITEQLTQGGENVETGDVKVTVKEPCDVKATVEEPCDAKQTVEEPCDVKPTVEEPCDVKATVEEPCDVKATVEEPCDVKATVEEPCDGKPEVEEVITKKDESVHPDLTTKGDGRVGDEEVQTEETVAVKPLAVMEKGEDAMLASEGSSGEKTDLYSPEDDKISAIFQSEESSGEQIGAVQIRVPKLYEESRLLAMMEDLEDFEAVSTDMVETSADEDKVPASSSSTAAAAAGELETESSEATSKMEVTEDDKTWVGSAEMLDNRDTTEELLDSSEENPLASSTVFNKPLDSEAEKMQQAGLVSAEMPEKLQQETVATAAAKETTQTGNTLKVQEPIQSLKEDVKDQKPESRPVAPMEVSSGEEKDTGLDELVTPVAMETAAAAAAVTATGDRRDVVGGSSEKMGETEAVREVHIQAQTQAPQQQAVPTHPAAMEVTQSDDNLDSMLADQDQADDSTDISDLVRDNLVHISEGDSILQTPVPHKPTQQPHNLSQPLDVKSPRPSAPVSHSTPSISSHVPRAADAFINTLEDFSPSLIAASSTPKSQASRPSPDKATESRKTEKVEEVEEASLTSPVSKKAAQADAIRRIDALLQKVDKEMKSPGRKSCSTDQSPKADSSIVEVKLKDSSGDRSFSVDEKFVTSRERKKKPEKSPSDSSEFTISTPSGSVESTSSVAELHSAGTARSSGTTTTTDSVSVKQTKDAYSSSKYDDRADYSTADSISLDNILESGMEDTLSIDCLLDADMNDSVSIDNLLPANVNLPTEKKRSKPPEIVLDGISTHHSFQSPQPSSTDRVHTLPATPDSKDGSVFASANSSLSAADGSTYYTPQTSAVEASQASAVCKTPDSIKDYSTHSESRSLGSRGAMSEDTLSDYSDQKSLGSLKTDAANTSPLCSPNRLIDAKRKFFFETSQPLRIDPRSVFKDISSKANEGAGRRQSRDHKTDSGREKTEMELLGLKSDWKKVENSTPTSPTAAIPHRNSVSGEKDLFYTPATSVKTRPQSAKVESNTSKVKKRLLSSASVGKQGSGKKGLTAKEIKSDDERLHEKNKVSSSKDVKESRLGMLSKAIRRPASAKHESRKSRSTDSSDSPFRRAVSLSDGATLSDQSEPSPATGRKDKDSKATKKGKTKASKEDEKDEATGEKRPRRSFLAMLLPSRSMEKRDQEQGPKSPTEKEPSKDKKKSQQQQKPSVKFRVKTPTKSSAEKKRYTAAEEEKRRSMYEEYAPLVEGMLGNDKAKKGALQQRIEAVAPPPAKAPNTALLPPTATAEDFDTESEFGDDKMSVRSFQLQPQQTLTEEEQAKQQRKHEKMAAKRQKEAQLKRLRMAQEIQRHLEEVEIKQRDVEERGVAIERALRGEGPDANKDEAELMQDWFNIVHEKNALLRYESDLMVHARELELEDRHSRLEQQLRDRLAVDDNTETTVLAASLSEEEEKTPSQRDEEQKIFQELMEVVEQRDALVALLDEDRKRDAKRINDLRKLLSTKGFQLEGQAEHLQGQQSVAASMDESR